MEKVNLFVNQTGILNFENFMMFEKKVCYFGLKKYLKKNGQLMGHKLLFDEQQIDFLERVEKIERVEKVEKIEKI